MQLPPWGPGMAWVTETYGMHASAVCRGRAGGDACRIPVGPITDAGRTLPSRHLSPCASEGICMRERLPFFPASLCALLFSLFTLMCMGKPVFHFLS